MVHRQADPVKIFLRGGEEQAPRRDIHRHHKFRRIPRRGPVRLQIAPVGRCDVRVVQHIGCLPDLTQHGAQPRRAAGGISVRAAVGQNQDVIMLPQQSGGFGYVAAHLPSSNMISALAGFAGLTTLGSRSISRIWAPCSMESSATNCSWGVYRSCTAAPSSRRR